MAQIVQVGQKSTIIEGSEAEINEIRQKLHNLGFNFDNYQYIELKEVTSTPSQISTPISQPVSQPNSSASKPTPVSQPVKPQKQEQPSQTAAPQHNPAVKQATTTFPYKVEPIKDGYQIFIPQSKLDKVSSLFPTMKNGQKKRLRKDNPDKKDSYYFFAFKSPYVEFSVYPPENSDEDHKIEIALRLLSLI